MRLINRLPGNYFYINAGSDPADAGGGRTCSDRDGYKGRRNYNRLPLNPLLEFLSRYSYKALLINTWYMSLVFHWESSRVAQKIPACCTSARGDIAISVISSGFPCSESGPGEREPSRARPFCRFLLLHLSYIRIYKEMRKVNIIHSGAESFGVAARLRWHLPARGRRRLPEFVVGLSRIPAPKKSESGPLRWRDSVCSPFLSMKAVKWPERMILWDAIFVFPTLVPVF